MSEVVSEHVVELKIENFKIFRAARLRFKPTGVTRIVGKNGAGKTTVLDAIMATLGGAAHKVDAPIRKGEKKGKVTVELTKLIVTRSWTGDRSTVEVRNKEGHVFGTPQAVLDQLIAEVAFDPLAFSRQTAKQQAETLSGLAGFDSAKWQSEYQQLFAERKVANKRHTDAAAVLRTIAEVDAPDKPVDTGALAEELQAADVVNAAKRDASSRYDAAVASAQDQDGKVRVTKQRVDELARQLAEAEKDHEAAVQKQAECRSRVDALQAAHAQAESIDTKPIHDKIAQAGEVNKRVQAKRDRAMKVEACYQLEKEADALTDRLKAKMDERTKALAAVRLGVDGLTVTEDGECQYNGLPLSNASTAEQLRVGVAIAFALNPKLKLCHIQDGSLLDEASMAALETIAEQAGFQVFVERVAGAGEVGIQIVDGEVQEDAANG